MQRVYTRPIVELAPGPAGPTAVREQLHIQLFRMALEELTRIWEALNQPLRLSVVYQVRFVRLDTTPVRVPRPITDRRIDAQIGRANGGTPGPNGKPVCRLRLEQIQLVARHNRSEIV